MFSNPCVCLYLIAHVNVSMFTEQQRHQVHTALLCSEVEGTDALTGHCVTLRPVFQQRRPDLQLILLSGDVKRGVAVLRRMREKEDVKMILTWIIFS